MVFTEGSELKFAVVGPSISRRRSSQKRSHSWSCDEACELNILESAKIAMAMSLLERCSDMSTDIERFPSSDSLRLRTNKTQTGMAPLGSEENHSTNDGSDTDEQQSSVGDDEQELEEGDLTVWPDTDSDDGFCSAWDIRCGRRGSLGSGSESLSFSADLADIQSPPSNDSLSAPPTPEPDMFRTTIKVRPGMAIDSLTTLMIRNLPTSLQQDRLVSEIEKAGFAGLYDFCHLPVWTRSGTRKGYAFVNMIDKSSAEKLSAAWHKTRQSGLGMKPDDQALDIVAANIQGREANAAMLREPRKRRGGKAARSAKAAATAVRNGSVSTGASSPKAPSMPPGTFHEVATPVTTPTAMPSAVQYVTALAESPTAASPQSSLLSILGFTASGEATTTSALPATVSAMVAVASSVHDGVVSSPCGRMSASPMMLSVPAPGATACGSVPR